MSELDELAIEERFETLLDPFKEMLQLVRRKKEKAQAELDKLRAEEKEIVRGLRFLDPEFEPNKKAGPKGKNNGGGYYVSDERLKQLTLWFDNRRDAIAEKFPQGWTGTQLHRDFYSSDVPEPVGLSSFQASVAKLHDRGVVRLDRRGQGGSKVYKAVGTTA